MQDIKSYCLSLIIISVTVGICLLLSPENRPSGKQLKFVGALCIAAYMLSPLGGLINADWSSITIPEIEAQSEETGGERNEAIVAEAQKLIAREVGEFIENKYGVEVIECEAYLKTSGENGVYLDSILVKIGSESDFLAAEIKKVISEKYECETYVSCE